jgi:hypothetical protein
MLIPELESYEKILAALGMWCLYPNVHYYLSK